MPGAKRPSRGGGNRRRWLIVLAVVFTIGAASAATGLAYAAHLEDNDAFCASCHTQPETDYYQRSLAQPSDLASAHAVKSVDCIQCHSGRGALGRVSAIATVAIPDLVAYRSGSFRRPAVVTNPIGDDHCLKCHADVTRRQDFNNHFHVLLSAWRARAPREAARCVDCHQAHVTNGLANRAFLTESTTVAVCQSCHAVLQG